MPSLRAVILSKELVAIDLAFPPKYPTRIKVLEGFVHLGAEFCRVCEVFLALWG